MASGRADPGRTLALLAGWIERAVPATAFDWLRQAVSEVSEAADERVLVRALGFAPRRLGRGDLILGAADLEEANEVRPGFDPTGLSVDQAARIAVLLASYRGDDAAFAARVDMFCRTAEINELIAYYRGLALFPAAERLRTRAGEGVRSGMAPVFEAVAHRNPYPREMFDERSWNQMIVKALFIGSTLDPIQGLDERVNADLAEMLVDYAEERWAAGRPVSPELWRCVGPVAGERALATLRRVVASAEPRERHAAVLALRANPHPQARRILAEHAQAAQEVDARSVAWADLA